MKINWTSSVCQSLVPQAPQEGHLLPRGFILKIIITPSRNRELISVMLSKRNRTNPKRTIFANPTTTKLLPNLFLTFFTPVCTKTQEWPRTCRTCCQRATPFQHFLRVQDSPTPPLCQMASIRCYSEPILPSRHKTTLSWRVRTPTSIQIRLR